MYFYDRKDAGIKLGNLLVLKLREKNIIVYTIPRGGVVVGVEVAHALHAPLDLVITRKIGHPLQPELAIAAISEDGEVVSEGVNLAQINKTWLKGAISHEFLEVKRRKEKYRGNRKSISPTNKIVILVDDGIATGLTIKAAILQLQTKRPKKIIVAVPIAPISIAATIKQDVDDFFSLETPSDHAFLGSIGACYQNFPQLDDEEVISLLENYHKEYTNYLQ